MKIYMVHAQFLGDQHEALVMLSWLLSSKRCARPTESKCRWPNSGDVSVWIGFT